MKTIKLTEKQFNIFKSIFEEGLNSRETTFENELSLTAFTNFLSVIFFGRLAPNL